MPEIRIGKSDAGNVQLDLVKLIDSRALIQANSGGGKSYLLRLIAEQAGSQNQIIIIDPEGEFASLRERLDLILVGQAGEIPANPRTAAPLARRLVESGASAVLDIYDLEKQHQRPAFVRNFLDALMAVPKSLYKPILIPIDEAQDFCPQDGSCQSASSIISLMAQGRKRGFCGLLATQRLSKLHKDAAAECNNVFIGRTWLDTDQKRAADMLGMGKDQRITLRDLAAGEWIAFGPAMNQPGVVRFKADQCKTTHPKAGERHKLKPPPPSTSVRGLVNEMADLSNRDPDEALTLDEAQQIIARLKSEARKAKPAVTATPDQSALDRAKAAGKAESDRAWAARDKELNRIIGTLTGKLGRGEKAAGDLAALLHVNGEAMPKAAPLSIPSSTQKPTKHATIRPAPTRASISQSTGSGDLPKGETAILSALIQFPDGRTREQLTVLTGYKRSTRDAYIQRLREKGFVDDAGGTVRATNDGISALPNAEPLPTGPELQAYWLARLPKGERELLEQLIPAYPEAVDREALTEATGHKRSTRDAYLQRMRAKQLIEEPGRGTVRASENLF